MWANLMELGSKVNLKIVSRVAKVGFFSYNSPMHFLQNK